jgi:hypothetical protein
MAKQRGEQFLLCFLVFFFLFLKIKLIGRDLPPNPQWERGPLPLSQPLMGA